MITIDWGTSSQRAYRLAADGRVLEQRSSAVGLLDCAGRFEAVLDALLAGWDDERVLMAGMVGSRNGWKEAPYVPCPAGPGDVAAALLEVTPAPAGRRVWIAPGLSHRPAGGTPEVMRGEETQLLGLLDRLPGDGPHTVCLPGTHSKWATIQGGRIVRFATAMTGELYAVLSRHSLLGALMAADAPDDEAAFARGVAAAAATGGWLQHRFGVRTLGLFGELGPGPAASYLSGLLIGHELVGLPPPAGGLVHLVGSAALTRRYARALAARHVAVQRHEEASTAHGLYRLAVARGLA